MGNNNANFKGSKNPNYNGGYRKSHPRLYNSWQNMKGRCLRSSNPKYPRYGGRGITVCDEWLGIKGFASWALNNGWKDGLTIDRIDNDKGYCPDNCRWVSMSENSRRKSTTKITTKDAKNIRELLSEGLSESEVARIYGVTHGTIWFINKGYTHVEDGECSRKLKGEK